MPLSESEGEEEVPKAPLSEKRKREEPAKASKKEDSKQKSTNERAKAVKTDSAKTAAGSITKHKAELESIKEQDPEFYNYLKKHDESLLEFGEDDEDVEGEAEVEETHARVRSKRVELTVPMLEAWETAVMKVRGSVPCDPRSASYVCSF